MGISHERLTTLECDICDNNQTYFHGQIKTNLKEARKAGWKIGKKVICPKCNITELLESGLKKNPECPKNIKICVNDCVACYIKQIKLILSK